MLCQVAEAEAVYAGVTIEATQPHGSIPFCILVPVLLVDVAPCTVLEALIKDACTE